MPKVEKVPGTAFVVAVFRAEENQVSNPLYQDPQVEIFLDKPAKEFAESIAKICPAASAMVRLRTRYFDEHLDAELDRGVRQVVILGSGLDTRALRKKRHGVVFYEIDCAETLKYKEARLDASRIDHSHIRFIPGNYLGNNMIPFLKSAGFLFDGPAYFIWEGNSVYLSPEDDAWVLRTLRDEVKDFRISFDYNSEKLINRTTGHEDLNKFMDQFSGMSAHWITGFDKIEPLAEQAGLKLIDNYSMWDLFHKYRPKHIQESGIFRYYSVCTLGQK